MVSTLKVAALIGLSLTILGCSEKPISKGGADDAIITNPTEIVSRIHQMTNDVFARAEMKGFLDSSDVLKSIYAVTNETIKLEMISHLMDCALSLDVSSLNYCRQFNALWSIKRMMDNVVLIGLRSRRKYDFNSYCELYYAYRLRLLEWQRQQIKRTNPKNRIENPNMFVSPEEEEERSYWQEIHYGGIVNYEAELSVVETDYSHQARDMSKETSDRVKAMIENFLGRPIRTKEQLRADFKAKRNAEFLEKEDLHAAP